MCKFEAQVSSCLLNTRCIAWPVSSSAILDAIRLQYEATSCPCTRKKPCAEFGRHQTPFPSCCPCVRSTRRARNRYLISRHSPFLRLLLILQNNMGRREWLQMRIVNMQLNWMLRMFGKLTMTNSDNRTRMLLQILRIRFSPRNEGTEVSIIYLRITRSWY